MALLSFVSFDNSTPKVSSKGVFFRLQKIKCTRILQSFSPQLVFHCCNECELFIDKCSIATFKYLFK